MLYTKEDMKRAFETGRNFQLTGENNFDELLHDIREDSKGKLFEKSQNKDEDRFELMWISLHVNGDYKSIKRLDDDEYICYTQWAGKNQEAMYKKHLPDAVVFCGKNDNTIFHGGCLGCKSQQIHGIERCKGCQYFRGEWSKDNLFILK